MTALVRGVENEAFEDGRRTTTEDTAFTDETKCLSRYAECRNLSSSKLISKGVQAARCAFLFLVEGH